LRGGEYALSRLIEELNRTVNVVNAFLEEALKLERDAPPLFESSTHIFKAGGKRLRPFLVLKACELVGGNPEQALPTAAAVEVLHNFTLIHDDIMDRDEKRRGVPTVHTLWGVPQAIITGDLLFAKVFEIITGKTSRMDVRNEALLEALNVVSKVTIDICVGQTMDMLFETRMNVTEREYLNMIALKTAALFRASAEAGAVLGGSKPLERSRLSTFGESAGMAFQLIDDVLGVKASEEELGKPVGSDIREGKKTLIVIHALENAGSRGRRLIVSALGNRVAETNHVREAIKALEETGSIEYTKQKALGYVEEAKKSLDLFPVTPAKEILMELPSFFVSRKF